MMFAPAMNFSGVQVPVDQLAVHLREYVKDWVPPGIQPVTAPDLAGTPGVDWVVYFPMSAADYIAYGAMLMEELHDADYGEDPDGGCAFLLSYEDYAPGVVRPVDHPSPRQIRVPAEWMYASLYVSLDGGLTWLDKPKLQLRQRA